MPRYEVRIAEKPVPRAVPAGRNDATLELRDLVTVQQAPSEHHAKDFAWRAWDAKYGSDSRPAARTVEVTLLSG